MTLAITFASGQQAAQTFRTGRSVDIKIYFPYDEFAIDANYMENRENLRVVDSLLRDTAYLKTLSRVEIIAQSSPEGRVEYNERLSERRRLSLEEYFTTNYPQINDSLWSFGSVAENWDLFHQHLVEDMSIPNRAQVLSVSESDLEADKKEWLLKTMNVGRPWVYIKENILPLQRFGASVLFIPTMEALPIDHAIEEQQDIVIQPIIEEQVRVSYIEPVEPEILSPKVLFALKTNLLWDAASVINLAAEIPIGNRFSVVGEVVYPWWRNHPNNLTLQIESYHGELKYWLGERSRENRLTGWSFGVYGGVGRYDVQIFSEEGAQGDFYDLGAHIGYSHSIAKNLYLEYTLGLGYISTNYNDYYMAYDTEEFGTIKVISYPWMNNKLSSVLPTRLGVSLVWHINSNGKGGSR